MMPNIRTLPKSYVSQITKHDDIRSLVCKGGTYI